MARIKIHLSCRFACSTFWTCKCSHFKINHSCFTVLYFLYCRRGLTLTFWSAATVALVFRIYLTLGIFTGHNSYFFFCGGGGGLHFIWLKSLRTKIYLNWFPANFLLFKGHFPLTLLNAWHLSYQMLTFYENLHFNIIGLLPIKWINKTELSTAVADANYSIWNQKKHQLKWHLVAFTQTV